MGRTALSLGANTFQFFTRNPRGSRARAMDPADAAALRQLLADHGFGPLVAHAPYTINPCSKEPRTREFAVQTMADDLDRLEHLPGNYYNLHPGSHTGQGTETGIRQIAQALNAVLLPEQRTTVLLETMAGKGTELGGQFRELREIMDRVALPVGVCLDTCHVWDAGYDICGDLDGVLTEFDRVIGLDRLRAVHLNDSLNPCGSHKDRHAVLLGGAMPGGHPAGGDSSGAAGPAHGAGNAQRPAGVRGGDPAAAAAGGGGVSMGLRLSAAGIFLLGALGLLLHSTLPQTGHIRAGMFCFYTNLSNLAVLLYELALAIVPAGGVRRLLTGSTVALAMTLCIYVTHLVYHFVLVPDARRRGQKFADFGGSFGNLCVHYGTPWLVVMQWVLWGDKSGLTVLSAVWWLALPLAYFAYAMLRARTGKPIGHTRLLYPYPFMDLEKLGPKRFCRSVAAALAAFFALGCVFVGLGRLLG